VDALVTTFIAAALGEWGDRTQLIVAALAARTGRPGIVMAGLFLAALASNAVAAWAGVLVAGTVPVRAMTLMVALALLFAGVAGLIPRKTPETGSLKLPLLLAAFLLCLAAETGDRTQFLTFALAGRYDSAMLAAAGATAGIAAACLPAALLGRRLGTAVPLRAIRYGTATLFVIAGFVVAVSALQLA